MTIEHFPIEAGHVMMFARSIGDPNPIYSDEAYAAASEVGAIIAPPTFVQASAQFDDDYPLRPKIGAPWFGSGREPTGVERVAGGGEAAAVAAAPACTPSSTTRTTGRSRRRRADRDDPPGRAVGEGRPARGQARVLGDDHRVPRRSAASSS